MRSTVFFHAHWRHFSLRLPSKFISELLVVCLHCRVLSRLQHRFSFNLWFSCWVHCWTLRRSYSQRTVVHWHSCCMAVYYRSGRLNWVEMLRWRHNVPLRDKNMLEVWVAELLRSRHLNFTVVALFHGLHIPHLRKTVSPFAYVALHLERRHSALVFARYGFHLFC